MWDVYHSTYKKGKCDECGEENTKLTIIEGVGRCHNCQVNWLMKKVTE
ncbi:MAG: hypothetical protein LLF83_03765 [Methanobacterium sp.]|nr:hypothetical protein [Methanobacterium sp.]